MKIAFITRTEAKNISDLENQNDLQRLIELAGTVKACVMYIVSNFEDKNYKLVNNSTPIIVIEDNNPISPISINKVLNEIANNKKTKKEPDVFLVCSKEVDLKECHIRKLIKEIQRDKLLVVGYRFRITDITGTTDKKLDKELQDYYNNKDLIAFRVPWNTCAVWNYGLFDDYVTEFDEITSKNPFNPVCVCIDNVCTQTEHKGMEDGLAIAKASSRKEKQKIYFKLLDDRLSWRVNSDYDKRLNHRRKLARKDTVLRNFMAVKNYSEKDLKNAEIK